MVEQVPYDSDDVGGGSYEDRTVKGSKQHSATSSNTQFHQLHSVQQQNHTRTINSHNVEEPKEDGSNNFSDSNKYYD